jgi:hypothetical protein
VTTLGLHDDIPEQQYREDRASLSQSGAKLILKAPAIFKWQQDHPVHRDYFDVGHAAHRLVLGVGPKIAVIDADDWRKKETQQAKTAARDAGEIPLLRKDYQRIQDMADALSANSLAMRLLSDGRPEVSAYALDEATGVIMRGRFDWMGSTILTDLKTVQSADPSDFGRTAVTYGYAAQAQWYLDLAGKNGHPAKAFAFLLIEKEPPHLTSVVELDHDALAWGAERNTRAREIFRDCTESGIWPGYQADGTHTTVSLPGWAYIKEQA